MGKKTSKHFRAASINADRHNRREKDLGHVRDDLQPQEKNLWMWEANDKKSIYAMRKQAEREYADKEVTVKGKYGNYTTHKTMPKSAEPIKEAVVVIKEDTTLDEVKSWADWCHSMYGIRPVGIYIHLDEGHWGELDPKQGQTEEMYRRNDGKEWKRLNDRGNFEYWKPNYHAHVVFDWFNHNTGRCINLDRQVMRRMEDELAIRLGMERGTPSDKKHISSHDYRKIEEQKRQTRELQTQIDKQESTFIDNDLSIIEQREQINELDKETKLAETRIKGLTTMLQNLEYQRDALQYEIDELTVNRNSLSEETEARLRELRTELQLTEDKVEQRREQLRVADDKLERILNKNKEASEDYNSMKREMLDEGKRMIQGTAWNVMAEEANHLNTQFNELMQEYQGVKDEFEEIIDGSLFLMAAQKAEDVINVATRLYTGFIAQAVNYAEQAGGGGGGGPESGWGRKDDEDEEAFRRRCLFASVNMLQPKSYLYQQENNGVKRKKGRGL